MCNLTCTECDEDFSGSPFGDDVQCPACNIWLETDMEDDMDNLWFWVTGKADDQTQQSEG